MQTDIRLLTLDVPEGAYNIFVVYLTQKGGEEATKEHLNLLMREDAEVLNREVYEPHYAHYKDEFGKTIQGFFSDEPRFGNAKGAEAAIWCFSSGKDWNGSWALTPNSFPALDQGWWQGERYSPAVYGHRHPPLQRKLYEGAGRLVPGAWRLVSGSHHRGQRSSRPAGLPENGIPSTGSGLRCLCCSTGNGAGFPFGAAADPGDAGAGREPKACPPNCERDSGGGAGNWRSCR